MYIRRPLVGVTKQPLLAAFLVFGAMAICRTEQPVRRWLPAAAGVTPRRVSPVPRGGCHPRRVSPVPRGGCHPSGLRTPAAGVTRPRCGHVTRIAPAAGVTRPRCGHVTRIAPAAGVTRPRCGASTAAQRGSASDGR